MPSSSSSSSSSSPRPDRHAGASGTALVAFGETSTRWHRVQQEQPTPVTATLQQLTLRMQAVHPPAAARCQPRSEHSGCSKSCRPPGTKIAAAARKMSMPTPITPMPIAFLPRMHRQQARCDFPRRSSGQPSQCDSEQEAPHRSSHIKAIYKLRVTLHHLASFHKSR